MICVVADKADQHHRDKSKQDKTYRQGSPNTVKYPDIFYTATKWYVFAKKQPDTPEFIVNYNAGPEPVNQQAIVRMSEQGQSLKLYQ